MVSIIGFPFGQSANKFALWSTGFVASEPAIDCFELPVFLVDCRARRGQSGSPVVAFRQAGQMVGFTDGSMAMMSGPISSLLGMYSGRINADSDLGMVWKVSALQELVNSVP
jgi:hypothetical protein